MREKFARMIVLITGILVVMLSGVFARIQNPDVPTVEVATKSATSPDKIEDQKKHATQGELVFRQQGCASCHSVKGEGNPRNPLDEAGNKYTDSELREWITGAEVLKGQMTRGIMKIKSKYQKLSDEELKALIIFLRK